MLLKENTLYEFEEFVLDTSERTLRRENETVSVTPKAIETLCLLVENHGKLLSKDDLMNALWADTFVEERNLAQNIFTLRKILGENGDGKKFIETVPRRGYRFIAEVRPIDLEREEFIEVSLAKQTTIKAEGNVSSHDLTEAVRETAKSFSLEKDFEENQLKRIETAEFSKPFYQRFSFVAVSILFISFFGGGFWLWQNGIPENGRNVSANANFSDIKFERLTDSGKTFFPDISRDKKQIVYVYNDKGKDSLRLQNLATGSVTEVIPPTDSEIGPPFFSNDGDHIFYRFSEKGSEGMIYRVPLFGGSPRKIIGGVRSDASVSPDGNWLSFIRYEAQNDAWQLIICQTDGTNERVIASRSGEKILLDWGQTPAWSPDNQKIIVGGLTKNLGKNADKKKIYLLEYEIASGAEKVLETPEWSGIGKFVRLPHQPDLIILAQESRELPYQIWQLSISTGEAKKITNDLTNYGHLTVAADGEFILTSERRTDYNLWLINLADKEARQITFKTAVLNGGGGLKWSSDGKKLVYTVAENTYSSNIWTMDMETFETRQMTFDENKRNWLPIFTPDSSSIIFASDRTGNSHIWQMDLNGENLRQITEGDGEGFPQITPDGNWLLYVSPSDVPQFLHKRPFHGGESVLLYDNAKGSSAVSPDSKQIVFGYYDNEETKRSPWKYGIKSLEPGDQPQEIGIHPYLGAMSWENDSSGFYYISEGRTLNNIRFYSVADGATKPVTEFEDLKMRFISLSPDGKQIAVSRGATVSNIIKIKGFR